MLTKASTNDPKLDIFYRNISTHIEEGVSVQSDEQEILHDIYKTQKGQQLYEHEHGSITSWLIAKSNKDQKDNYRWENCYGEVHRNHLPHTANIISSHHFFEVKNQGIEG